MGYAIARAAANLGAETILISGPTALPPPESVRFVSVESTRDLHEAVREHFDGCDCLIMSAAPSDYRPVEPSETKLKRTGELSLKLKPTVDILRDIAPSKRNGQIVVGFALETNNGIENARKKLIEKQLDLIVLNQPGKDSGFGVTTNRVTLLRPDSEPDEWPLLDKGEVARRLMEAVAELLG